MLLGRERERQEIDAALRKARAGTSATLALVGEPGIGKTALLHDAAERANGMRLLRARGVESEAEIPFAALLELLRPALRVIDQIPEPQAGALESALALRPGSAQQRFAVGAATLSLVAAYAEAGPVAIFVDDAHWLDGPSAQALLFAFRRLIADPVAVLIAVREGEPSLIDGSDLPRVRIAGLTGDDAAQLLPDLPADLAERLHAATAGNPLALLELASEPQELGLAPAGAPVLVPARIAQAFLRRTGELSPRARGALLLAATSGTGEMPMLERAASGLGIEVSTLAEAEQAGLVRVTPGLVEFRHPLARSAVYAAASAQERRAAHRALAAALPDRDVDRRAWHLAAAALGADDAASAALEQAGTRSRDRSAYATAATAFERAARLAVDDERAARLLLEAASAAWAAGLADRAAELLAGARETTASPRRLTEIDKLAGHITWRRGRVMDGYEILVGGAEQADPELAVPMLCEAASACFYAGRATEMLAVAERAHERLAADAPARLRFMAMTTLGMARILAGDAAAGAEAIQAAIAVAESNPELCHDVDLIPWLAWAPIFMRQARTGRPLLEQAVKLARSRAAVAALPLVLGLVARDQATTDRWSVAQSTYEEALALARESDQRTDGGFCLVGLAWLHARRGRADECRAVVADALALSAATGTRLHELWAAAALGELELGAGDAEAAIGHFEHQRELLRELAVTDVDISPAPELVDAYLRTGRGDDARALAAEFVRGALAKGQPWSVARALRCQGLLADDDELAEVFDQALAQHAATLDAFELARTQLTYGERLRRSRNRVRAREQLRPALETFERLGAEPWAERARAELAASGETLRRRDPSTLDELTPQELQIAMLLASGRTTREAAAALFLSPKTIEYHLRHVYLKLGVHSRDELARAMTQGERSGEVPAPVS